MKVKELIEKLNMLVKSEEIYIANDLEIYEPEIQSIYDNETKEGYFIITRK